MSGSTGETSTSWPAIAAEARTARLPWPIPFLMEISGLALLAVAARAGPEAAGEGTPMMAIRTMCSHED
ncbi:MAG: hypothetical protein Q8W51_05810 [Candidatus Palauibacterales bacterium]|nr:hypothetical protein [Candidatus Palauibacterales bacterium]